MGLLSVIYNLAAEQHSGFAAEQILFNRGFFEIGRRTDAVAWTTPDSDSVVRISRDAEGSEAYFKLAQKMQGNPYFPIVFEQQTLKSGDHIALVERLENPAQKIIYPRFKEIKSRLDSNAEPKPSDDDIKWLKEMKNAALVCSSLRHFFSTFNFNFDINSMPEPKAFLEASIAITQLSTEMNKKDPRFVPCPDINETNVMWRRTASGLFPVLYDSVSGHRNNHAVEEKMAIEVRRRLGMDISTPQLG
jgi:hypothetical protein